MITVNTNGSFLVCCAALALMTLACEEKKPDIDSASPEKSPAAALPAPSATAIPAAAPPAAEAEVNARPTRIDTELTADKRSALETQYPKAKNFIAGNELEEKLKANKAIKDKKSAVSAFDKVAKGKWVLFSGPLVNLTDQGFDLGVVYTAQIANDPMGMSRQFFEVTLTDIQGYQKDAFKAGNVVVVLAQYSGDGKAGPGYEVVSTGAWK